MEATNLAGLYQTPLLDWARIETRLGAGVSQAPDTGGPNRHTCWLTTINPDGSPHVTGIGALWADGHFWFETGKGTRKGRNLARDPRCALSVRPRNSISSWRARPPWSPIAATVAGWPRAGRRAARQPR